LVVPIASSHAAVLSAREPKSKLTSSEAPPAFEAVYDATFDVVWRNLRRLGVPDAQLDDAVQEVFLVVHRRLSEFEGRASLKTWVCAIVTRVASDHRRVLRRKSPGATSGESPVDPDSVPDAAPDPQASAEREEGVRRLHALLDALDDDKRTVLVLADLEELAVPEIAEALGENLNTVYARLRAARKDFEQLAARARARDDWRLR
jgi:RNA polymerase sigma-70 factor (ECF subfamily)